MYIGLRKYPLILVPNFFTERKMNYMFTSTTCGISCARYYAIIYFWWGLYTHDHEDRARYWLTDAEGRGQPIRDKFFMVKSRPNFKVCFALWNYREFSFTKIDTFIITALFLFLKKRLLLRCIHHFKSDLINNMDHKRISGTEPSPVIFSQTKKLKKLKSDRWGKSSVDKNRNPEYTTKRSLRCAHSEVQASKCCLGQSETSKIGENSRSFNNFNYSIKYK